MRHETLQRACVGYSTLIGDGLESIQRVVLFDVEISENRVYDLYLFMHEKVPIRNSLKYKLMQRVSG